MNKDILAASSVISLVLKFRLEMSPFPRPMHQRLGHQPLVYWEMVEPLRDGA